MGKLGAIFGQQVYVKKFVAKITQATTAAPATGGLVVDGLPEGAPAWARTGTGVYTLTLAAAFVAGKTFARVTPSKATAVVCEIVYTSANVITFNFFDVATPSAADSGDFDLDIEVFP